jgi:hypothetical protein
MEADAMIELLQGMIPSSPAAALTLLGAVVLIEVAGLMLRIWVDDTRQIPRMLSLVALALAIVTTSVNGVLEQADLGAWIRLGWTAFVVYMMAVALAVFGWEMVWNELGLAGIGRRADGAVLDWARGLVRDKEREGEA